jgi:hypothetical protein
MLRIVPTRLESAIIAALSLRGAPTDPGAAGAINDIVLETCSNNAEIEIATGAISLEMEWRGPVEFRSMIAAAVDRKRREPEWKVS